MECLDCRILTYNTHGLPWSKNNSVAIANWIQTLKPDVICLQEVFCVDAQKTYVEQFTRAGYTVCIPRDSDVTLLSSGLLTASLNETFVTRVDCFCSFQHLHNVEWFANKGFHVLRLFHKGLRRHISIANTHTQSSTEISWWFGNTSHNIRFKQVSQMLEFFKHDSHPVLIAGDFNCPISPHPHLRFLHPKSDNLLKKRTFYSTDEDLDHIAWMPLQWAKKGCLFCDVVRRGPILESCQIFVKPWSDHAPVFARVRIPQIQAPR